MRIIKYTLPNGFNYVYIEDEDAVDKRAVTLHLKTLTSDWIMINTHVDNLLFDQTGTVIEVWDNARISRTER